MNKSTLFFYLTHNSFLIDIIFETVNQRFTKSKNFFQKTMVLILVSGYNSHCKEIEFALHKAHFGSIAKEEKIWLLYILHRVALLAEKHELG
ncbi:hypothetical protein PESHB4_11180 [Pediococcus ethanolidurans]